MTIFNILIAAFRIINKFPWGIKAVIMMGCVVLVNTTDSLLSMAVALPFMVACLYQKDNRIMRDRDEDENNDR